MLTGKVTTHSGRFGNLTNADSRQRLVRRIRVCRRALLKSHGCSVGAVGLNDVSVDIKNLRGRSRGVAAAVRAQSNLLSDYLPSGVCAGRG